MTKSETAPQLIYDRYSIILLAGVLFIGTLQLLQLDSLPEALLEIILAISAIIASFFYFLRVKNLENATTTPISDTLVVIGGIYVAIALVISVITSQFLSLGVAIIFIFTGIVGRLFLFDSILERMILGLWNTTVVIGRWFQKSYINPIRVGLVLISFFSFGSTALFGVDVPYNNLVGIITLSVVFWIDIIRSNVPHSIFRVLGIIASVISLLIVMLNSIDTNLRIGLLYLCFTVVFWSISLPTVKSWGSFLKGILPGLVRWISRSLKSLFNFISDHRINFIRITLTLGGIILLFLANNNTLISFAGILLILSAFVDKIYYLSKSMITELYEIIRANPVQSLQFFSLITSPLAYLLLPSIASLNVLITLLLLLIAVGPTLFPLLYEGIMSVVTWIIVSFKEHPVGSTQVSSLLLMLPSYLLVPTNPVILGTEFRVVIVILLLTIGVGPSIISWLRAAWPVFVYMIISTYRWLERRVHSPNTYYFLTTVIGLSILLTVPSDQYLYRIGAAILTMFGLSMLFDQFLMRLYDSVVFTITRVLSRILGFFRFLIPSLKLGVLQSFLAWVLLFMGITGFYIPQINYRGWLRFGIVILSIIIWNTAYPKRRERFINFINKITAGIVARFYNFLAWLLRNIFVLALVILGLVFIVIALGLIFPGAIGFVEAIFGSILDNRLVSWIIGGFLVSMGIFTLQQAFARRSDLQFIQGVDKQ